MASLPESIDEKSLLSILEKGGLDKDQKDLYIKTLNAQLRADNHDLALDERLEIINTCFTKTVNSVVMAVPDSEEA